ncbi:MAG: hypothetical protein ACJ8AH_21195, partial [Stellaceae bacterium]
MFLKKQNGECINLDLTAKTKLTQTTRGITATTFTNASDRELGNIPEPVDLERLTSPVLPASGPAAVAVFVRVGNGDERPELQHLATSIIPLVGWRVLRNGAEPIFSSEAPRGVMFLVAAGSSLVGLGQLFRGFDEAQSAVLAAQREWDAQSEHVMSRRGLTSSGAVE